MRISDWSSDVCSSDLRGRRIADGILDNRSRGSLKDVLVASTALAGIRTRQHSPFSSRSALVTTLTAASAPTLFLSSGATLAAGVNGGGARGGNGGADDANYQGQQRSGEHKSEPLPPLRNQF